MAIVYVHNNLYPDNAHVFIVDVKKVLSLSGEAGTSFWQSGRAEHFWKISIYTSGLNSSGDRVGPFWYDLTSGEETLNEFINDKIEEISRTIDWSKAVFTDEVLVAQEDRYPPYIYYQYPSDGQADVPIDSRIIIRLREILPARGINLSSITMSINGMSITPEIEGNPYDYTVSYRPLVSK